MAAVAKLNEFEISELKNDLFDRRIRIPRSPPRWCKTNKSLQII